MAAFASAIRTNSDSYNFWGMVNSERDVQQRYYTWKALVSLTLLFFFSQRLPFPDGAKSTWHNCSSVSGFSLEVFASNQPSQASSWNWQARNWQGRDWKRDSWSTEGKLTLAEWKARGVIGVCGGGMRSGSWERECFNFSVREISTPVQISAYPGGTWKMERFRTSSADSYH